MKIFAQRLRQLRESKKLIQEDMGQRLGVSGVAYGDWERNKAEPSLSNLLRLCQFFGVSADYLIGTDGTQDQNKAQIIEKIKSVKADVNYALEMISQLTVKIQALEKEI